MLNTPHDQQKQNVGQTLSLQKTHHNSTQSLIYGVAQFHM